MFTLNVTQRVRLAAIRAFLDESERRFDFWSKRETQVSATQTFSETLAGSNLRVGLKLTEAARRKLLQTAGELAPNGNLSHRLTSIDPNGYDDRLRRLLFGPGYLLEMKSRV